MFRLLTDYVLNLCVNHMELVKDSGGSSPQGWVANPLEKRIYPVSYGAQDFKGSVPCPNQSQNAHISI